MSANEQPQPEITYLKGIGPKRAEALKKAGIDSFDALLNYCPRRYLDRSTIIGLDALQATDEEVTVVGKVEAAGIKRLRKALFYIVISDGKGMLEAVWFNAIHIFKNIFKVGDWVALSGKVTFYRGYQMTHPDFDILDHGDLDGMVNTGKVLPLYPGSDALKKAGVNSYVFRRIFRDLFKTVPQVCKEVLPDSLIRERHFLGLHEAYRQMHLPESVDMLERARYRFIYEEFFYLQLLFALQRYHVRNKPLGISFDKQSPRLNELYKKLPFEMTQSQKNVMREIRRDMKESSPMNRLLQGDVGAGKTLVAMMAALVCIDNGYQVALMAPTEILAEQHFINTSRFLGQLGVKIALVTGGKSKKERAYLQAQIRDEQVNLVVGTHALLEETVQFARLGLVIIDEQHRFGVLQRGVLMGKGEQPDVLVMTATPIPRTLALTAYGSLEVSVIDELPKNRKPVRTVWRKDDQAQRIYAFLRERLDAGEQVYMVFPLVEESEKSDLKAATDAFNSLSAGPFKKYKLGLLHGRMKSEDKEAVMRAFANGDIHMLITTTVVEVGVDVANATIMLIEHAERFGLSQLHQLRGRVGRGAKQSYCILKTPANVGEQARARIRTMTETNDGFVISEKDLELRGWGDLFGTRQSGVPLFRLAHPVRDRHILEQARRDAFELVDHDPQLRAAENAGIRKTISREYRDRLAMFNIS